MNKNLKWISIGILSCVLFLGGCSKQQEEVSTNTTTTTVTEVSKPSVIHTHGSAETLEGTTLVYTIFVSDKNYSWDVDDEDDANTIVRINDQLNIAGRWLEKQAAKYGKSATFITDFVKNMDLVAYVDFPDEDFENADEDNYSANDTNIWHYIDSAIDVEALKEGYNADNIIFFTCYNTDYNSSAITCARNWYEGMPYDYEIVYMYNIDYGDVNPPSVYAHEMLHTFGAPDYYTVDTWEFNFDEDDIAYVQEHMPNEIMLTCSNIEDGGYEYTKITNEMSELTAYFVGLTDHSETAKLLELTSQHDK